jgi:hypothetical protein
MRKVLMIAAIIVALTSISFAADNFTPAVGIRGNYIEARTADVYTGPCVANGEAEQVGREAILGWKINAGSWKGVDLAGLSVVGVLHSVHTLGLATEPVNPAQSVLIVDSRANAEQRRALEGFAKHMGGSLLAEVLKVDVAPIQLDIQNGNIHNGAAKLTAGNIVTIQTRAFTDHDHMCGNEEVWYSPLTKTEHAMPAYALENEYKGTGLGQTWNDRMKRSSFVGTFQVTQE